MMNRYWLRCLMTVLTRPDCGQLRVGRFEELCQEICFFMYCMYEEMDLKLLTANYRKTPCDNDTNS